MPDYRVISATVLDDARRRVTVESDPPQGWHSWCAVATKLKEGRRQRIREITIAGQEVLRPQYRW